MQRVTVKTSLVLIATGAEREKYRIYRSVRDVPPALRRRLLESTTGPNADTLVIVDQRGREEIHRVVEALPEEVRKRYEPVLSPPPPPSGFSLKKYRPVPELILAGAVGLVIWALSAWR
jgi:hypothetical protein